MKKLLWISLLFSSVVFASFKVGDRLPNIVLQDQFGKTMKVDADDKLLLLTFEKEVAIKTADLLKTKPKGYMETHHIKYISDISKMPSFITSMFALPKMKKYPFSVMLIENDLGSDFAKKEGKVTVYKLKKQKITSIQFVEPKRLASMLQ
jgi:hypothetical protein